jgi:hypothetical protein
VRRLFFLRLPAEADKAHEHSDAAFSLPGVRDSEPFARPTVERSRIVKDAFSVQEA